MSDDYSEKELVFGRGPLTKKMKCLLSRSVGKEGGGGYRTIPLPRFFFFFGGGGNFYTFPILKGLGSRSVQKEPF